MKGRRWILTPQGVKIGRADSCEIQVSDIAAELFHCVVKLVDGKPTVLNLASDSGVDVNGTNVDEAGLDPNDTIRIGNERFIVLASGRKRAGSIAGKIIPLAILVVIAAVGAYFYRQHNGRMGRDSVVASTPAVSAVMPSDDSVTTNRVVKIVNEEIVTTNRVVHIVDNVVVTNYVIETRRASEKPQMANRVEKPWVPGPTDGLVLSEGGLTFLSAPKGLKSVAIPGGVTKIADRAFADQKELMYVLIPPSVAEIGTDVFNDCGKLSGIYISDLAAWCSLSFKRDETWWLWLDYPLMRARNLFLDGILVEDMEIPQGVTGIGENAFRGCPSIVRVTIPDSVVNIGAGAFADCSRLAEIAVDENNQYYKSVDGLLLTKDGRTLVAVPAGKEDVTIPKGVVVIGDMALLKCKRITKLDIPNGVTEIGFRAFSDCVSLSSISYPPSMAKIGHGAFYGCDNLADIYITDIPAWCGLSSIAEHGGRPLEGRKLYLNGALVDELKIPDGVTRINDLVFSGCDSLARVSIPRSVEFIGWGAFAYCKNLKWIEVAGGNLRYKSNDGLILTKDGKRLVAVPAGLEHVKIPHGVETVGGYAFADCNAFYKIPDGIISIEYKAFNGCRGSQKLELPNSLKHIGGWSFSAVSMLESITIPENVEKLDGGAFAGCRRLKEVIIKYGVMRIGTRAFEGTSITNVSIPGSVERIGGGAFRGSKLENLTLKNGVKDIGEEAFKDVHIKSLVIPESVTNIATRAFCNCKQLERITVPEGLTDIAENAFEGCDKLLDANGKPRLTRVPRGANADKMPKKTVVDKELDVKLPPYEIIDSRKSLAMGGASGGDEVRIVVNTNGTCDIIHIFTETEVTKTLVVPKNNRIIPNSGKFLVVGGGGTSSTWDGRGGGGAGGVVFRKNVNVVPGTAYVYVGSGGERYGWHGRNGDDSILTLCGKTYVAIGGGAGGGFSGGSGGGGQGITGQIGKGLQTKSASGGIGHDGFSDKGEIRCGGGGAAAQSSISGDLVMYAKGGVDEVCSPAEATGAASTGSGASFGGWDGPSFFKLPGGSGIVVLRYAVKRPVSRLPVSNIPPEFPGQDRNVRTKWVSGIEWHYFVGKDGSATIGSHAEACLGHPDLWQPAVDINALSGVVKIPDRIDGWPVRRIGKGAFQGCMRVTKFVVPDGVTHCGPRAFARCSSLEVVEYPGSIQWLGDGQVYNSRKIKYLRFQSAPPQCDYGRCPFKGTSGEGVCLGVPFALQSGWQNRTRWLNDQDKAFYRCNDGCHLCPLQNIPSDEDMKEATRNNAGFVSMQFKWKSLEELKSSHTDIEKDSNVIKKWQNWLGLQVETVWRNFERIADRRVLSPCFDNPEMTATIFVGMMHFRAFEPVYFRHRIDNYGMIMVDDKIALEFDVESSHDRTVSSKDPIVFPVDGWHRLAIISANGMRESGGWANYKRGEKGKWRNFEANPEGAEFRVTKEDSLRAVADIERAKHK